MGQGQSGPQGKQGPLGPDGPQGPLGPEGPPGKDGQPGKDGSNGKDGINGTNGKDGVSNIPGPEGPRGPDGPEGPRGPEGPKGEVTKDFMKGNSLWCADGELCKIPNGKKGMDWGYGGSRIIDDGHLKVISDDNIMFNIGDYNTVQIHRDNVFLNGSTALQFGQGFDREANAGQISYGRHDGGVNGSLNIIGGGKNGQARVVRVWDTLRIGDAIFRQDDDWVRITGDANNNGAYNKGLAAKNLWARDSLTVAGRNILAELDDLKANVVRKDKKYAIQNDDNRRLQMENGTARAAGADRWGNWEAMRFIQG